MSVLKIDFYLRFHTRPGQTLHLSGNIAALGDKDPLKALSMQYMNSDFWHVQVVLEQWPKAPVSYHYILHTEDGKMTEEWGGDRQLEQPAADTGEMQVMDTWNWSGEYENVFYTAPFRDVLLRRKGKSRKSRTKGVITHIFKVKAPLLKQDETLCLLGSGPALKDWESEDPLLMVQEGNWWTCRLSLPKESLPVVYKYGVYHMKEKRVVLYENGDNRYLHGDAHQHTLTVLHDGFVHLPNNTWRGAGVAIPVFSLRTKKSMGVGEFTDLKLLIDWAVKCGLKVVQILPVNDTTANHDWQDSYPYAAISAFALHPLYLNLEKCAGRKYAELIKPLKKRQKELNELPQVDYEAVMKIKLLTVKELYEIQKVQFEKDPDYIAFFEQNKHWLIPYAAFCYLRDKNGTPDFSAWKSHRNYDKEAIEQFVARGTRHYASIALQYFIQYHLHLQLREAADHAHENGVIMKGDIPIGIYRYSCDAWMEPRLYHIDQQAGAPPDNFAVKGQNWGFPTYNWEEMEKDGFCWWKQRFEQMSNYFDGFRIDHILGFFRIWSIPMDAVQGILGHFVPAIPVHRVEFGERNLWFDHDRYTRPFINDAVLWELFGNDSEYVKANFLWGRDHGTYVLREAFDTQRKVEAWFNGVGHSDLHARIRDGLYDLISNIILMDVEGSGQQQFHFRIAMDQTSSFRYLEWHTQQGLKDLYVNYFFSRQDAFWEREAMHKLPALKRATNMLVFGEDLGMVPRCVPDVMRQLGILSLEIQRMPKNPAREFFHPNEAPYLSVVTPSTHDMSTIRGWWEEDREKIQRFFNQELGQWGEAPYFCEPWVNKAIVLQHLHSPAQWSIFQLQDLLGMSEQFRRENPHDERINVPADPKHYWRYRMHLTLEELIREKEFNDELKGYVEHAGR
ncbi:4-alpha-glucanotransferase [Flavitalea sp. BT771]|uniref:4-alpha-glucanotransferase n=1 Tax=Flavitalea sp. BT771 TaxID=3063329 RepID=UPI0026E42720|nr:4-alpha-glucanotransferase [Flavitalea sp. BT771]MDO6431782.1 4-alpha-glucanotransferase [Flavitalea sp. BT771]MDV6220690.1 4-alpha-glucanotransferase [Flavitalea sp. BT771]